MPVILRIPVVHSCFLFVFLLLLDLAVFFFFFFNDTATTEIYTLSLHDALPISARGGSTWRTPTPWPRRPSPATSPNGSRGWRWHPRNKEPRLHGRGNSHERARA